MRSKKYYKFFLASVANLATNHGMTKTMSEKIESPVSIRLYPEQKKKLKEVSRSIRLSEQDCLRKALDFGLPLLKKIILEAQSDADSEPFEAEASATTVSA